MNQEAAAARDAAGGLALSRTVPGAHAGSRTDRLGRILDHLACPVCHQVLRTRQDVGHDQESLQCEACREHYPIVGGIVDLRPARWREKQENEWSVHWSDSHQQRIHQRFFSLYRKVVFARTVRYFADRYFPPTGIFVEAGCGTAETSMRIRKAGGGRTLVGLDLVPSVLERCHPNMDVRLCGDIFTLPFHDASIDGIWNVGVMEHFTRDQIDQIMREFHRVLRPDATVIMLWPGADSIPQKMLRAGEAVINLRRRQERFRFHLIPDEVSQLRSKQEGSDILRRNGFVPLRVDYGFRSLLAFKTVVGAKAAMPPLSSGGRGHQATQPSTLEVKA